MHCDIQTIAKFDECAPRTSYMDISCVPTAILTYTKTINVAVTFHTSHITTIL